MKGTTRIIFSLVTLALVGMQLVVLPAMPAKAISTAAYYGPPASGTFSYNRNTTYLYNYSYTITTGGSSFATERWIPMVTNRTLLGESGTVLQQEFIITNESYGSSLSHIEDTDDFGNEYHYFDLNVAAWTTWAMNVQGRLTLRDIGWSAQDGVTMTSYNTTDALYPLYTKEELYINKSYAPIAAAAAAQYNVNPWTTAANVYNYVTNTLTYTAQLDEHGAEWAIDHGTGDCTEFSYLMVALLRACGIPARVMRGIVIANSAGAVVDPDYDAAIGTKWRFAFETSGFSTIKDNLTGHAWAEYFIPGAGWVLSDPTWHAAGNFISRIDNVHVPFVAGLWIGQGLTPALSPNPTENLSTIPYPFWVTAGVNQAVHYDFTVLSQEAPPPWWTNTWLIVGIIAVVLVVVLIVAISKHRKSSSYSDSGSYRERVTFSS
jgi:hypothetical protein